MCRTPQQKQPLVQSKLVAIQVDDANITIHRRSFIIAQFLPSNSINLIRINAVILNGLHRCTGSLEPLIFAYAIKHLTRCAILFV